MNHLTTAIAAFHEAKQALLRAFEHEARRLGAKDATAWLWSGLHLDVHTTAEFQLPEDAFVELKRHARGAGLDYTDAVKVVPQEHGDRAPSRGRT